MPPSLHIATFLAVDCPQVEDVFDANNHRRAAPPAVDRELVFVQIRRMSKIRTAGEPF
jgi:hypothetical protein